MKKARFSEEQVVGILKQHEPGMKTADLCREHNISGATFHAWKAKYSGLEVNEAHELKRLVAPAARRTAVSYTIEQYRIGERRACRLAGISRSSRRYQPTLERDDTLRNRIRELARALQRFGHLRLTVLLPVQVS